MCSLLIRSLGAFLVENNIKSVFDAAAPDFKVDLDLIKRLREFDHSFTSRNEDHIAFFGGQLTGVHPMRFRPSDREKWFVEILRDVDEGAVEEGVAKLDIPKDWVRANDTFNQSAVWLVHRLMTAEHISPALRQEGAELTIRALLYKYLGSVLSRSYPYPADEGTAQAALNAMSRKFLIKTHKNWGDLIEKRAAEIISPRSVYRRAYMEMKNDKDVIYMISDIQNRIRELIKSINKIFYKLHEEGKKVVVQKSVRTEVDGSVVMQDRTRQFTTFIRYLNEVMDDPRSFVIEELIEVVSDGMRSMNPNDLRDALTWMSRFKQTKGHEYITELANETLIYAFGMITSDRELYNPRGGLMPLITKLRAMYMASRMADPTLLKTKELAERVVRHSIKSRNESVIASVKTGVQLYLVIRAMAMQYYQNNTAQFVKTT